MRVIEKKKEEIRPYEKNPRKNEKAVASVAESIREFGWKQPIVVDKDGVIVAGHTRYKAAKKLGMETVPVVIADDLTDEQVKAYRLADNKTADLAEWDFDLLNTELAELGSVDMKRFGFNMDAAGSWFEERKEYDNEGMDEESEEYQEFIQKFEIKRTTDDCYTPKEIHEAVMSWVEDEYKVDRGNFVRPFYPGGDYQKHKYNQDDIVVDNPPFSILAEIVRFYTEKEIKFFIYAPGTVAFSGGASEACVICTGVSVTYENNANVNTSFITNLEDGRFRTAPGLHAAVKAANEVVLKQRRRELPKYKYPDHVVTASMLNYMSHHGVDFRAERSETYPISELEAQKEAGKAIYGKGYLLSDRKAAEKAAAEKAAAEKAAAECWQLREKELNIIEMLNRREKDASEGNMEETDPESLRGRGDI